MKFEIDIYINNEDNSARFVLGYKKENPLIVMGVNPSTANDDTPDPTIRRVLGYMRRNGFGGFIMLNVYPQHTPCCLTKEHDELLHKQNLEHIERVFQHYSNSAFLIAFGNTILVRPYLKQCFYDIVNIVSKYHPQWKQIGNLTAKGHPRHPSRGAYQELKDFDIHQYLDDFILDKKTL